MKRDIDPKAFGRRVQERRLELNRTQTELATASGMRQQGVGAIEAGEVKRPRGIDEIAAFLATTKEWLWWGTPPKDAPPAPTPALDPASFQRVPLIDAVTAGKLAAPSSQIPVERVPLLAFADLGPGEWFATKVDGSSMDRLSPEGSIVIVNRRDRTLITGKAYIFAVGGETTYKRWQAPVGSAPPYLAPFSTDPSHQPIFVPRKRDFEVVGRVKRTVLDL